MAKVSLKPVAKVTGIVFRRGVLAFVGWLVVGVLNSLFGLLATFPLSLGSIIAWENWGWGIALSLFYIIVSPVVYFILAKNFAITRTVFFLLSYAQEPLWVYILTKYFAAAKKKHGKVTENKLIKFAKAYKKRLGNMPWLMRNVVRVVLWIVPFFEVMEETLEQKDLDNLTPQELANEMAPRLSHATADMLSGYASLFLWGFLALQWLVVALAWWLL